MSSPYPLQIRAKAFEAFISGNKTLRTIAEENGVKYETLINWASTKDDNKLTWQDKKRIHKKNVFQTIQDEQLDIVIKNSAKVMAQDLALATHLKEQMKAILDRKKATKATISLKDLNDAARILKQASAVSANVIGLGKPNTKKEVIQAAFVQVGLEPVIDDNESQSAPIDVPCKEVKPEAISSEPSNSSAPASPAQPF